MPLPVAPIRRRGLLRLLALWAGLIIVASGPLSVEALPRHGKEAPQGSEGLLRESAALDDPPEVLWQLLAGLDYTTGTISEELLPFVGREVRIPGFMVPLEDFAEHVSEFLLVPYVGACVHTPPPPPNQLVYVEMERGDKTPVMYWDPIWIHGTLEVEETTNVYGSVSFRMSGIKVTPYEW